MKFINLTRGDKVIYVNVESVAGIIARDGGATILLSGIGEIQVSELADDIIDHMGMDGTIKRTTREK